jgi:hypothetical protein
MKNPNDPIGNRTHNLPACSAVPQPTAPPSTVVKNVEKLYFNGHFNNWTYVF